ncbi:MAG: hypothetical protein H0T79_00825 [Deltaproteobacteria bacterium]|nr:hypothetical protein [Deltaproteobacteria bacterium]
MAYREVTTICCRASSHAITVLGGGAGSIALAEPDGSLRFRTVQAPAAPQLIERTLHPRGGAQSADRLTVLTTSRTLSLPSAISR